MTKRNDLVKFSDSTAAAEQQRQDATGFCAGDHLFYYRAGNTYSHHGIYVGDGRVVHYESSLWMKLSGGTMEVPTIRNVDLEEFSQGSEVFVRQYDQADGLGVVMVRAHSRLDEASYSLFENNCEHFAIWCKTGFVGSTQVDAHRRASRNVLSGMPIGLSLLKAARRVPRPYRHFAYAAALAAAGGVYATSYFSRRMRDMERGVS